MDDLKLYGPTIIPMVPKLLQRVYDGISKKIDAATGIKGWLLGTAIETKQY